MNSSALSPLYGPTITSVHDYWKNHSFVGKVMSLLFNALSRFVIAFLPRSNSLSVSWLQLPSTMILVPKKKNLSTENPMDSIQYIRKSVNPANTEEEEKQPLLLGGELSKHILNPSQSCCFNSTGIL